MNALTAGRFREARPGVAAGPRRRHPERGASRSGPRRPGRRVLWTLRTAPADRPPRPGPIQQPFARRGYATATVGRVRTTDRRPLQPPRKHRVPTSPLVADRREGSHVTIVSPRADGPGGVRWSFCLRTAACPVSSRAPSVWADEVLAGGDTGAGHMARGHGLNLVGSGARGRSTS